jgi:uncharacterized protein
MPDQQLYNPATVVMTRTVKAGREEDYRRWLTRLIRATEAFPNNLGTVVLAPPPNEPDVFRVIHRFSDEASLRVWEDSPERRQLTAEADAFSTLQRQAATGMEAWFAVSPTQQSAAPKQWKMALMTFAAAYVLTAIIIPRETVWLRSWSFYEINIVTNVLLASLLTYVIMPVLARLLRRWLY